MLEPAAILEQPIEEVGGKALTLARLALFAGTPAPHVLGVGWHRRYAERWLTPELDVYPWLVETYCEMLERGDLAPADFYIYLDPPIDERRRRRASDANRRRNDMFFTQPFPTRMRRFYWILMHPDSQRAALPALWHHHLQPTDVEAQSLWRTISERAERPPGQIDVAHLVRTLRSTVADPADMEP